MIERHLQNGKMSVRFNFINIMAMVLMAAFIFVVAAIGMTDVSRTASRRIAYHYALESVGRFNSHVRHDLALVRMASNSSAIREWFADENNPEKRLAAYNELVRFASALESGEFYFAIYDSLNEFSFDVDTPFHQFVPYGALTYNDPMDAWFFDLINSENEFLFNIDIDKIEWRWRVWINHIVVHNEQIVGVLCSAVRIDEILRDMFGRYDEGYARGFIVDRHGIIHMDSVSYVHYSTLYDEDIHIRKIDPTLGELVDDFLGRHGGFFTDDTPPEVIRISSGDYNFAAVAPIANSDWLVVALFNSNSLFSIMHILPFVAVLAVLFILYMLISLITTKRYILNPIICLTKSVFQLNSTDEENPMVYGDERNDEIGDLSRTIQSMWTEIKNAERTDKERLRAMVDSSPLMCVIYDEDFNILEVNQKVETLLEIPDKQIYIDRYEDFFPKYQPDGSDSKEKSLEVLKQAFEKGSARQEWICQTFDKKPFPCEETLERIKLGDKDVVISYVHDLREFYKHQKTKEALEAKSNFIANISHEIRTPMNSILGYSELALDDIIPNVTREHLEKIIINTKLLLNIINDVLDLSKIESGNLELEEIPFSIKEVIEHCQSLIMPSAAAKGITLDFKIDILEQNNLTGDPTKLSQVCINILSNAIKFTNNGGVVCSVIQLASRTGYCALKFEFKDTGIGMSEEQIAHVFEPFVQADSSTTRKHGGTGLGLAITKRMIEAMDGSLSVDSSLGLGSKFSFTLTFPTVKPDAENEKNSSLYDMTIIAKPHFSKGEVLVVDDNDMNLGVACEHLKRVGLTPFVAENGKEAVEAVKRRMEEGKKSFDLIFMDMHMPEMDGREAASIISKLDPEMPIVAMTAETMAVKDEDPYKPYGMKGCLSKPFTAQELWKCLLKYLGAAVAQNYSEVSQAKHEPLNENVILLEKLKFQFVKGNQTVIKDIKSALDKDDIKLAHRLAHTLKTSAKLISKHTLSKIAEEIESQLRSGENLLTEGILDKLETEIKLVLAELAHLLEANDEQPASSKFEKPVKNSILIVDDDMLNVAALSRILKGEYTIYISENGTSAIEMAKKHLPDLILLDIVMSDMNGYEVLSQLKNADETKEIPVIFLTGLSNNEDEKKGLKLGAADYISKPFNNEIVKLRVRNQMDIVNTMHNIKDLSNTDPLTGIPNRRDFSIRMASEWTRAMRNSVPLSLIMADIDDFKKYNDTYGHPQGDVALKTIAKIMSHSTNRKIDMVVRWGGEEFAVLLPETSMNGALKVAEKIRKNIEEAAISNIDGGSHRLTISLGVNTIIPTPIMQGNELDDFIAVTDKALYTAKRNGKNRTEQA